MATKKFTKRECENIENIVRNKLTWNDDVHIDAHLEGGNWFIIEIDEEQDVIFSATYETISKVFKALEITFPQYGGTCIITTRKAWNEDGTLMYYPIIRMAFNKH